MARTNLLRVRRTAAQLHALKQVERQIRAADPYSRRKYLREYSSAYQNYDSVIPLSDIAACCLSAQVVMIGDYHALPASQLFAADLIRQLAASGREIVLGVEFILARHQRVLDAWMQGSIGTNELRDRVRFDMDWGYDWRPYRELLEAARRHARTVCALDCMPRSNLRRIAVRDRHAATRIADLREQYPDAIVLVLFGESHLAPEHLPGGLRHLRPNDRILTILQNNDTLYWQAAGEPSERVDAVRVTDDVVCVFNATPLEKYESYRLCIDRWRQQRPSTADVAPAICNMVSALLRFLNIEVFQPTTGAHAVSLIGDMPEIRSDAGIEHLRRLMLRQGSPEPEIDAAISRIEQNGICFVPALNAIFVRQFNLGRGAEEAARFVYHTCRRTTARDSANAEDRFYRRVLEEAMSYFGSRALYPARDPVRASDLYSLYSVPPESIAQGVARSYDESMQMVDFLALHKDYEANCRRYRERPELLEEALGWEGPRWNFVTRWLGRMLGSGIYDAYVRGTIDKRQLRSLFMRRLDRPGTARTTYFVTVRKIRTVRRASVGKTASG